MESVSYIERATGQVKTEIVPGEKILKWLYYSASGKIALHLLFKRKIVSALGGWYMNTKMSAKRIQKFVSQHNINIDECQVRNIAQFKTFNDFFYRKLKDGVRPLGAKVVAPADGKILVFPSIKDISSFFVKGSEFTLKTFLMDEDLAEKYMNGAMAVIRLAPADYHRFHFPANGIVSEYFQIKGKYFSVSPLALKSSLKTFCENKRGHSILTTQEYGDILISEIGATMVGGITQTYQPNTEIKKGDEKGYFSFAGSTLVLIFEKDKINFSEDLISNTKKGLETSVLMGENITS